MKLLLGDEVVFEQQLAVVIGGLARDQLLFLHGVDPLMAGRRRSRLTCRPDAMLANAAFDAGGACATPARRPYAPVLRNR